MYRTIELFAGAGGLALGVENAGFDTIGLVEYNSDACDTLKKNKPNWRVICDDIANISALDLEELFHINRPFLMPEKDSGLKMQEEPCSIIMLFF